MCAGFHCKNSQRITMVVADIDQQNRSSIFHINVYRTKEKIQRIEPDNRAKENIHVFKYVLLTLFPCNLLKNLSYQSRVPFFVVVKKSVTPIIQEVS